jgi:predicted transcriptional regulator
MARPLTLAQREEISAQAYQLSLAGRSTRAIAKELGVTRDTVSRCLKKEAARRRAERPDHAQHAVDSYRQAVRRCWEELEKDPSPHAVAQLIHALNTSLSSIDLINGVRAPSKSITYDANNPYDGLERLSNAELGAFKLLIWKMSGQISEDVDVLALITKRYAAGTLAAEAFGAEDDDVLELEPLEDPDTSA